MCSYVEIMWHFNGMQIDSIQLIMSSDGPELIQMFHSNFSFIGYVDSWYTVQYNPN